MTLKNIVVEGCTLELSSGSGVITILPNQTSKRVKCGGLGVYTQLKFAISGYTGGEITIAGSGSGSGEIVATAQKEKVDSVPVFLEGDESQVVTINGLRPAESGTAPATANVTVKVSYAGQDKAKGI